MTKSAKPSAISRPLRQCWGRLRSSWYVTRCGRHVEKRFCGDHRSQPWVLPAALALALLAVTANIFQVWPAIWPINAEQRQLRRTAYTRVSMATHYWKLAYFSLYPQGIDIAKTIAPNESFWNQLEEHGAPEYNHDNWKKYYPLFNEHVERFCQEMQNTQAAYLDILEAKFRSSMEGTCSGMRAAGAAYYYLSMGRAGEDTPLGFHGGFVQAFHVLGELDAEAQRLRDKYKD